MSKPKAIYLIRHGESEGNVDESLYKIMPDWKVNLTENGKSQAICAAKELCNDIAKDIDPGATRMVGYSGYPGFQIQSVKPMFYISPWYRTRQTAQFLNILGGTIYEDPRLREQEWGNYAEDHLVLKIEKERKRFGSFYYRMPNGESGADVYDRITTFIDTLHRDFEKEDYPPYTVIVSHGLTIKAFLMRWFHWHAEDFDKYKTPKNCEIIKMKLNEKMKYDLVTPLRVRPDDV